MKQVYFIILLISISGCKNNGNFDKTPPDWKTFEKSNSSQIVAGKFKFKYPSNWAIDETETNKSVESKGIILYPTENLKAPSIILTATFLFNTKSSLDGFVDNVMMPTLKLANKKKLTLNGYDGYVLDVFSLNSNVITKVYAISNGERVLTINHISDNKEVYEKTHETVDSILDTIVIE